ncbi:MAG: DNA polymerase/3'-5' exonuclease PolX [Armatimonadota bacterium]|nr:DNA polymerase/3'-5' exonuclease PolX [Armatimonadota bacterium]MCX7778313.1 DNA polymerase/3'-5' exonuclease PolX [Armatimonadota bacterium]MDW8025665.1 DNA polymerase/3'-5' exonuclease PolX [Armatimonadota bacterium]
MRNDKVAEMLEELGDLKEILGENPFKVRAYRRAAEAIRRLTTPIEEMVEQNKLSEIDGVGESLAAKITEFIRTGKVRELEELRGKVPPSLRAFLDIPDMGPRTAWLVYERLGITTIEELERAAREGRLRHLPGMGPKKEENIIRGIQLLKTTAQRVRLDIAWKIADYIIGELVLLPQAKLILPAGSLRRMKETIGDVDILVATNDSEPVMDKFVSLDGVRDVLAKGTTKSSVLFEHGLQVDVRAVHPESFGAAAQYFTGSKDHNISLRERGIKLGLKINEYGVFREPTDEKIAGETEEGVYEALGLLWIPPEMRENRGEIEAAERRAIPSLIELDDIRGDLHIHSNWSDGSETIEALAKAAVEIGYEYIAITDHSPPLGWGVKPEDLRRQITQIRKLNEHLNDILILTGVEVDILHDGTLALDDELLSEFDVVIASIHSQMKMSAQKMTERILRAMENPYVNIIGHPTGRLIGQREPYEVDMEAIVKRAASEGIALEINASPERLDLKDEHARMCKDYGAPIAIGTDAHAIVHLEFMKYGVGTARRGWLEPSDVINTKPVKAVREFLIQRRPSRRSRKG